MCQRKSENMLKKRSTARIETAVSVLPNAIPLHICTLQACSDSADDSEDDFVRRGLFQD